MLLALKDPLVRYKIKHFKNLSACVLNLKEKETRQKPHEDANELIHNEAADRHKVINSVLL